MRKTVWKHCRKHTEPLNKLSDKDLVLQYWHISVLEEDLYSQKSESISSHPLGHHNYKFLI